MNKVLVCQIIFLTVQVIGAAALTAAVLGDMDPEALSVSALIIGVGMAGNAICAIIRAVRELKKK